MRVTSRHGVLLACLCAALVGLTITGLLPLARLSAGATREVMSCWHGDPYMDDVP